MPFKTYLMSKKSNQKPVAPKAVPSVKPSVQISESSKTPIMAYVLAAFCAILTYAAFNGAKENNFVSWDDPVYVEENPDVLNKDYDKLKSTVYSLNYHPLTMISLAMNVDEELPAQVLKPGDHSARPFISTNILLHCIGVLLAFWLAYLLSSGSLFVATFVAAFFGIHPMHVESVAWVAERKDVLYGMFFLAACIAYWKYTTHQMAGKSGMVWYIATIVLFLLSCLSKAMAVALPLCLLLIDYWRGRNLKNMKPWVEKAPLFAIALFFGLMALSIQSGGDFGGMVNLVDKHSKAVADAKVFSTFERLCFGSYGYMMYWFKLLVPTSLSTYYPYPFKEDQYNLQYALAPLFMLGTFIAALFLARRNRVWLFGIGWFFFTVALVLQFISVGTVIMADRYTYLPYFGLLFLVAMLLNGLVEKRNLLYPVAGVSMLVMGLFTYLSMEQVKTWENSETLWSNVIKYFPRENQAYANRGNYYGKIGKIDLAMSDLLKAKALGSQRANVYEGLGNGYGTLAMDQNNPMLIDSAIMMFNKALELDPKMGNAFFNRGIALMQKGRFQEAVNDFNRAAGLMGNRVRDIGGSRGYAYYMMQNYDLAIKDFTAAINAGDRRGETAVNRGECFRNLGKLEEACNDYRRALELKFVPAQQYLTLYCK